MKVYSSKRVSDSYSDNRQSKTCPDRSRRTKNRKWVGCLAILLLLTGWVRMAGAQQTFRLRCALMSLSGMVEIPGPFDRAQGMLQAK